MRRRFAIVAFMAALIALMSSFAYADDQQQDADTISVKQAELNSRNVTVTLNDLDSILAEGTVDAVTVTATMSYNGKITEESTTTKELADIDTERNAFNIELPYFGKWNVVVNLKKGEDTVGDVWNDTVGVAAEEYNIATLAATTDVLIFSLRNFVSEGATPRVKTETEDGTPIPTIVTLNRFKQYDWDNLPNNFYRDPLLSESENYSAMSWDYVQRAGNNKIDRMKQYVKELSEINPESKFNFYVNDYQIYSFPRMAYANGLTDDQYTLTMITDGSGSYTAFKSAYEGVADAQAKHDQLVSEYKEFKAKASAGETEDYYNLPSGLIRDYEYAIVDAEDAQWWVVRKSTDTMGLTDAEFQSKVLSDTRISNSYINSLLSAVQSNGQEETFKTLYKFEDEAFNATRANGKKIMMILGTSKTLEDKYPVTDYVRFMVATMGDDYEFYYKGHPGNYTANSEENTKKYEDMGIQMLDPSIAAELFLFYNDDIYLCGYESSLYNNASNEKSEEQDVAIFRRTLESAKADPALKAYADYMDYAISDLTDDTDYFTYAPGDFIEGTTGKTWDENRPGIKEAKEKANKIRAEILDIIPSDEASDKNYLVQYNNNGDKTVSEYDYAIWNSDKSLIHYVVRDGYGDLMIVKDEDANKSEEPNNNTPTDSGTSGVTPGSTDQTVASAAAKLIDALPAEITAENEDAVAAARAAYDKLTPAQQALVPATTYAKLTAAEGTITYLNDVAAAKALTVKITKAKNVKGTKAKVTYKTTGTTQTGYQVKYSTNKKLKRAKTKTIKKATTKKVTVKKLKKGKTYYFKVRTYTEVKNPATGEVEKVYGKWSKAKKVKIKK